MILNTNHEAKNNIFCPFTEGRKQICSSGLYITIRSRAILLVCYERWFSEYFGKFSRVVFVHQIINGIKYIFCIGIGEIIPIGAIGRTLSTAVTVRGAASR